jgi:RNA dependent RNA polymerase
MISWLSGPDHEQRTRLMNVLKCGLEVGKDPFLFACSLAIRSHQLLGLRKKARIFVNDGAVLMGGLDVTKLLPEGCVFVQVRKSRRDNLNPDTSISEQFEPIVGPVMVTKHPVMHPGDVRMLLAVDIPELRNHKNVILFSQLGDRPEADKMGGSDLDGDEFAVTWDSRLFLGEWNKCSPDDFGHLASARGRVLHRASIEEDSRLLQIGNSNPMSYDNSAGLPPSMALIRYFLSWVSRRSFKD